MDISHITARHTHTQMYANTPISFSHLLPLFFLKVVNKLEIQPFAERDRENVCLPFGNKLYCVLVFIVKPWFNYNICSQNKRTTNSLYTVKIPVKKQAPAKY